MIYYFQKSKILKKELRLMLKLKIKAFVAFFMVVCLCFSLCACGEDSGSADDNSVSGEISSEKEDEKPKVVYTEIVCHVGQNTFKALKSDGSYDDLKDVYGTPVATADGKYIFSRQAKKDPQTGKRIEKLFVMQPGEEGVELANKAVAFVLSYDESCVVVQCNDGVYFTNDFSKPCEKIADIDAYYNSCIVSETKTKVAYLERDENILYLIDISAKEAIVVDKDVLAIAKRFSDNALYYVKNNSEGENCLYVWDGTASNFVSNNWKNCVLDAAYTVISESGNKHYFLNSDGKLQSFADDDFYYSATAALSPNKKYYAYTKDGDLYRYEITENGLTNKTVFEGKEIFSFMVHDSGAIVACDSKEKTFALYDDVGCKKIFDDHTILSARAGYGSTAYFGKDCVYFLFERTLYKYSFTGELETIAESVYSFASKGDYCYYLTNYNNEFGDVFQVGADEKICGAKYINIR